MKWLKILIDIALAIIPGLGLKAKKNIETELEIAQQTIEVLSKNKTADEKSNALITAIGNLEVVKNFDKRASKKLKKAGARLFKKFLFKKE